jgi:hypothetical protein
MSQDVSNVASSANLMVPGSGRVWIMVRFAVGCACSCEMPNLGFALQTLATQLTQKLGGKAAGALGRTQSTLAIGLTNMSMSFDAFAKGGPQESCVAADGCLFVSSRQSHHKQI